MPTYFFPLNILTQVFEDETGLSEALNFHEVSRFDTKGERRNIAIRDNAERILKKTDALELVQRIPPIEFETGEITLPIEPPRNSRRWRKPVELKIHFLRWQQANGYLQAFVPVLGIAVLSKDSDEFEGRIEREIRAALLRTGASESLKKLSELARIREIRIEKSELAVDIKTPKQRAIDENNSDDEKSVLAEVATKLNDVELSPVYEVEPVVEQLAEILKSKQRHSVLLIGASGVGKTAVFQELVRRRKKYGLAEMPFYSTSGARLVAGQTGFGMWQERCQKLAAEAREEKAVLHLGNLVELLEVGKSTAGTQGIASFFRPKIARGELQVVVECTPEQLSVIERRDANLLTAFQQMRISEPTAETGLKILEQVAAEFGDLKITAQAVKTIEAIHRRYATYSAFPGRPVRFLRNLLEEKNSVQSPVSPTDVLKTFSNETGLPLFLLSDAEQLDLSQIENWFEQKVLGQPEAIKLIVDLIATVKAKLTRPRKPIASLLFIGGTGIGKTELTKALAEFFFNNQERLARFDMSEFSTQFAVERLIGGAGDAEGQLTAKMREQPFSVLLFDELEKAHPQFFDLLLQILGEGRLTDASGRVADFTNSIIVMTSNLGAETFNRGRSGFLTSVRAKQAAIKHFTQSVRDFFRPEIYNRIDRIVPFAPLDEKTARTIAELEIEKLKNREGVRFRQIKFNLAKEVVQFLAQTGYDVRYGARPLRRAIERELLAPFAAKLNEHLPDEKLTIEISLQNNLPKFAIGTDALQKQRSKTDFVLAALANRAAELRRKAQKLTASYHLTELADERFQLVKIADLRERGRWVSPEDIARLERLPKIRNFLAANSNFGRDAAQLEDSLLLEIYGKAETVENQFADELAINELRLQKILFDLLDLKTEQADEVSMAIHGENAPALFRLARCYLQCIEEFGGEAAEIYCLTTIEQSGQKPMERLLYGRTVWQIAVPEPQIFFAQTQREVVEASLKIVGKMVKLRFAPEAGVHYFITGNKTDRVGVATGDFIIQGSQLSEKFAARGSLDDSFYKRRFYNADTKTIDDQTLDKKYDFDGRNIAATVFRAIEENLQQTANALLD